MNVLSGGRRVSRVGARDGMRWSRCCRCAAIPVMLVVVLWLAPSALAGAKLVQFVRPTGDTLVQKGTGPIRVIVQLRGGARLTKVDVDGVVVTRLLRRGPGPGAGSGPGVFYGALLRFSRHLHYGFNDAFVQARGRGGRRGFDHVRFIVAKRDRSLLHLTSFRTETAAAPLQVGVRESTGTNVRAALSAAAGVSARVYVNNRRVDRGFSLQGGRLFVRLGAGEGLRFGRNLVQILVHKTHPYKRQSSYDMESRTVFIARNAPIASAGEDHTITGREFVRFDGRATKLPPGWTRRSFRWKIVSAPKGSKARLRGASSSRPSVVPGRPGVYEVRVSVRGTPPRASRSPRVCGLGHQPDRRVPRHRRGHRAAGHPAGGRFPRHGFRVRPRHPARRTAGPRDRGSSTSINYAVLDRKTLQITNSGSVSGDVGGIQQLGAIVDGYSGSLEHLVVINWENPIDRSDAEGNALSTLLQKIGSEKLTDAQRDAIGDDDSLVKSAVGVAGAPAGSAFVAFAHGYSAPETGVMSGYLRLNGVIGKYDFVFTDPVDFDTETNQTQTDDSPAQLTIKIGDKTYTRPNPGGGVSGFHLLYVDANTLEPVCGACQTGVYTTNAADGAEQAGAVRDLASDLTAVVNDPNRPLVILQAFGTPHGNDGPWDQVAKQIERLGGTRQVFNAMNAVDPRSLNGDDSNRKGPYAFVGRVGSIAPLAEASYSLNGLPGRLRGVLMRARDGGYEPMIAGPPRSDGQSAVNTELIRIANEAPRPFPAFKDTKGAPIAPGPAQAVQKFLGGPKVTSLCSAKLSVCDIRKSYYLSYSPTNWSSIQDDLTNAKDKCSQPNRSFTASQCEGIRAELRDEVSMVAKVTQYFGPLGLQQPFGAVGVSALANLTKISHDIETAVAPPPADNTTANVLTGLSILSNIGYASPKTTPVGAVLYTAFALGAYFTRDNGSPNLIGPQVTTAASKLGVELTDHYQQAGNNLNDLGRLIVSDYGKLSTVASKVDAQPGPGETDWRLGNIGQAQAGLEQAAEETIYESLVPARLPGDVRPRPGLQRARLDLRQRPLLHSQQAPFRRPVGRCPVRRAVPGNGMESDHCRRREAGDGQRNRRPYPRHPGLDHRCAVQDARPGQGRARAQQAPVLLAAQRIPIFALGPGAAEFSGRHAPAVSVPHCSGQDDPLHGRSRPARELGLGWAAPG